ncbi:MAG: hypothetical protein WC211_11030 [Dehalococcoidia bacterium]
MALIASPVQAATTTAPVTAGASLTNNVIGTTVPNGALATISNASAVTGSTALVAGDTITITFPAGYTVTPANVAAGDFTIIQAADGGTIGVATAPTAATATANSITLTVAAASLSTVTNAGRGVITINLAAGGGNEILVGNTAGTGTLTVSTSKSDSGTATVTRIGVSATPNPASVPADGVSTSVISVAAAAASTANGETITIVTNNGAFVANTVGAGGLLNASVVAGTPAAPLTTVTFTAPVGAVTTTAGSVTLRAPTTGAGSAQISVFATPAAGGSAQLISSSIVTFTAQAAVPVLTSITVTPTATQTVAAAGGAGNAVAYTITLLNQNGTALGGGTTVTVSTSGNGVVDSNGTTCNLGANNTGAAVNSDADCTYPSTGGGDVVEIYGINVAGATTVTVRATPAGSTTPISVTRNVTFTGLVDTLAVTTQYDNNGGANFAIGEAVASSTPNSATFTAGFRAVITAKDSAGNAISGFAPDTFLVNPSNCAVLGGTGNSSSTLGATQILTVGGAAAGTVCTITVTEVVGTVTKTATGTFTIGSALSGTSVVTVNAIDMATVSTQAVTVDVKDASGNAVGDGTSVTLVASAGAVATATAQTVNGTATFTYVSPGTAQNVNLTAVAGTVSGSKAVSVGGAVTPPPAGGPGTFAAAPSFGTGNVGSAVFQGGTIEQLVAAVTAAGGTSVWVQDSNGTWRSYNTLATGSAAFVNNGFNTAFAAGFGVQAVFVVR